jgi:hypothetical protein
MGFELKDLSSDFPGTIVAGIWANQMICRLNFFQKKKLGQTTLVANKKIIIKGPILGALTNRTSPVLSGLCSLFFN